MDEEIDKIIDQLAEGTIKSADAITGLIAAGMTEDDARYNVRSMETIDVHLN